MMVVISPALINDALIALGIERLTAFVAEQSIVPSVDNTIDLVNAGTHLKYLSEYGYKYVEEKKKGITNRPEYDKYIDGVLKALKFVEAKTGDIGDAVKDLDYDLPGKRDLEGESESGSGSSSSQVMPILLGGAALYFFLNN